MRNAVAHAADEVKTERDLNLNSIRKSNVVPGITIEGGSLFVGCSIEGRVIRMPNRGKMVTVEVTDAKLNELGRIKSSIYAAFEAVDAVVEAQRRIADHR